MAFEIQEYVSKDSMIINWNCKESIFKKNNSKINNLQESTGNIDLESFDENSIFCDIDSIHDIITRNFTLYTENCMKLSEASWTNPYMRPFILHHNEEDGKIIGRVICAKTNKTNGVSSLNLLCNVADEEGKKGIKNRTYLTTSIGAIVHEAYCSICGQNLAEEGACEHQRGEYYEVDGQQKLCYWIIEKIEAKEISAVIVPSDSLSCIKKYYTYAEFKNKKIKNSKEFYKGVFSVAENAGNGLKNTNQEPDNKALNDLIKSKDELIKSLNASLEQIKIINKTNTDSLEAKDTTIKDLKKEIETLKKKLEELNSSLETKTTLLDEEIKAREKLEQKITDSKESLIEDISLFKDILGLESNKEELLTRTTESLNDTLKDLKSEVKNSKVNINNIKELKDPTLKNSNNFGLKEGLNEEDNFSLDDHLAKIIELSMDGRTF